MCYIFKLLAEPDMLSDYNLSDLYRQLTQFHHAKPCDLPNIQEGINQKCAKLFY